MMQCEKYQELMLEAVYGLLDADIKQQLHVHAEQCAQCRDALARAERQQGLLAAASTLSFPGFMFTAPDVNHVGASRPATLAIQPSSDWIRWSMAAAVIIAVAGLGVTATRLTVQQDRFASIIDQLNSIDQKEAQLRNGYVQEVEQSDHLLRAALAELEQLAKKQQAAVIQVRNDVSRQTLQLTITGPRTPEPGALNRYLIQVRNNLKRPTAAKIRVLVRDANQRTLFDDTQETTGSHEVSLPRDLPIRPGSDLTLEVTARGPNGQEGAVSETLTLGSAVYLTHLATDRPLYRAGETVRFRSTTLERFSFRLPNEELQLIYVLIKPNGEREQLLKGTGLVMPEQSIDQLLSFGSNPLHGIGAGEYLLPLDAKPGSYTLVVSEARNRFLAQERQFSVLPYELPALNKSIEFARRSYGPGDTVTASIKATRSVNGQPAADIEVVATVRIDGKVIGPDGNESKPFKLRTNSEGQATLAVQLPAKISRGAASVGLIFRDGKDETVQRPIPLALSKLNVDFYPEGGDLVAGFSNNVYFQATTLEGKPADLRGRVVDERGIVVAEIQTMQSTEEPMANHGMGRFTFKPELGRQYQLRIDLPAGIEGRYPLPATKDDGIVLSVSRGVIGEREPIATTVQSTRDRALLIGAYCRGRLMAYDRLSAKKGESVAVALRPESGVGGVYRVTVFEEAPDQGRSSMRLIPKAERLLFRNPAEKLHIALQSDKPHYSPGERVQLRYRTVDENGKAIPTVLMAAVVDESLLSLADDRTIQAMPTQFLLTSEIRQPEDFENADFLLSNDARSANALDLLLGTQGWRRFAEQDPGLFRNRQRDSDSERLLVLNGQLLPGLLMPAQTSAEEQAVRNTESHFSSSRKQLEQNVLQAKARFEATVANQLTLKQRHELEENRESAQIALVAAAAVVDHNHELASRLRATLIPVAIALLIVFAAIMGMLAKGLRSNAKFCWIGGVAAIVLCGLLYSIETGQTTPTSHASNFASDLIANHKPKSTGSIEKSVATGANSSAAKNNRISAMSTRSSASVSEQRRAWQQEREFVDQQQRRQKYSHPTEQTDSATALSTERLEQFLEEIGQAELLKRWKSVRGMFRTESPQSTTEMPAPPLVVREYAYRAQPTASQALERPATVLWQPVLLLPNAEIASNFDLGATPTRYRVLVSGLSADGRIGAVQMNINSLIGVPAK